MYLYVFLAIKYSLVVVTIILSHIYKKIHKDIKSILHTLLFVLGLTYLNA